MWGVGSCEHTREDEYPVRTLKVLLRLPWSCCCIYTRESQNPATGTRVAGYANRYHMVNGATTTNHIFSPDGTLLATIESTASGTTTNYVHTDHLGGTNVISDSTGDVVEVTDYYPFGEQRIHTTTGITEARKYTGHEFDTEANLTYAKQRYYEQDIGKWLSIDPASRDNPGQFLRDPQQLNMYSYGRNNPLILVDRTGEKVYLAASSVLGFGTHIYYYVAPESASKFAGIGPFTLGARPSGFGTSGYLEGQFGIGGANPDSERGLPSDPNNYFEISTGEDVEADDALIRSLYLGHVETTRAGRNVFYRMLGNTPGSSFHSNSNNYAYSLAESADVLNQFLNFASRFFHAPGANQGVPKSGTGGVSFSLFEMVKNFNQGGGGSSSGGKLFFTPSGAVVNSATGGLVASPEE